MHNCKQEIEELQLQKSNIRDEIETVFQTKNMIEIEIKDLEEIIDRMNKNKVLSTSQRRSKEGRINKLESLYQQNENLDVKLN